MTLSISKQTTIFIFCKSTTNYGAIIDFGLVVPTVILQVILMYV